MGVYGLLRIYAWIGWFPVGFEQKFKFTRIVAVHSSDVLDITFDYFYMEKKDICCNLWVIFRHSVHEGIRSIASEVFVHETRREAWAFHIKMVACLDREYLFSVGRSMAVGTSHTTHLIGPK